MTTQEFNEEFRLLYDLQSKGGPSIDAYEVSLFLTLAAKEIQALAVGSYDSSEQSRRLINDLLIVKDSSLEKNVVVGSNFFKYKAVLPERLMSIFREKVSLKNCIAFPAIVDCRLDELNVNLVNPFKRPNKRRVLRVEEEKGKISLYSSEEIESHNIVYCEIAEPIIVEDLEFGLTIEGKDKKNNTNLNPLIHSKIVELAVSKAINTTRTRLQKQ
jgi:hypothetical protein